jgi:putative ABC transport system permease protein
MFFPERTHQVNRLFEIAIPTGYYFMNQWLSRFAYRIELGPVVFIIAAALVVIIALFTVSARAIKAAILNPVDSLRNE